MSTNRLTQVRLDFLRKALADRYAMRAFLGKGAFASVYLVRNRRLERLEALKVLSETHDGNSRLAKRFVEEAKLVASLDHPNIVKVYDYGEVDGIIWCAMQYIDGPTLRAELNLRRCYEPQAAASLVLPLLDALEYSHGRGVVHRDIKPGNIILSRRGRPFLMDFGIAKSLQSTTHTVTGSVMGTPLYIAPEHAAGERSDGRSDVYSLATTLYEMIAGTTPFASENVMHAMMRRLKEDPEPLSAHQPDIDPGIEAVVHKGLARDRRSRFATAGQMSAALVERIGTEWKGALMTPMAEAPEQRALEASPADIERVGTKPVEAESVESGLKTPQLVPPGPTVAWETPTAAPQDRQSPEPGRRRRSLSIAAGVALLALVLIVAWSLVDRARDPADARRQMERGSANQAASPSTSESEHIEANGHLPEEGSSPGMGGASDVGAAQADDSAGNGASAQDGGTPAGDEVLAGNALPESSPAQTEPSPAGESTVAGPNSDDRENLATDATTVDNAPTGSGSTAAPSGATRTGADRPAPQQARAQPPRRPVTPARILEQVEPQLEGEEAVACAGVSVVLALKVDAEGVVSTVKVLRGAGESCDRAAIRAASEYQFRPALDQNDQPIESSVTVSVRFGTPRPVD